MCVVNTFVLYLFVNVTSFLFPVRHKTLLGSSSRLYKFSQSLRKLLR